MKNKLEFMWLIPFFILFLMALVAATVLKVVFFGYD